MQGKTKWIVRLVLLVGLFWAAPGWGAEYWVDNSRENMDGGLIGIGTEVDPFNKISAIETIILPGSVHTIHLIGTNRPYEGGLGGFNLKKWVFGNCKVIRHESEKKKVIFYATRTIPLSAMSGLTTTKTMTLNDDFQMNKYTLVSDGTKLYLRRLNGKDVNGVSYDVMTKQLTIDTLLIPKISILPVSKDVEGK